MLPRPDIGTTDELVICLTDEDLLSTTDSPAEKYAEYLERIATLSTQGTKRVVVKLNTESPSMYTQPDNAVAQEGLRVLAALFATLPSCNQVETFDGTGVEFTPDQTTSLAGVPHIKLSDGSIPALPVGFDGCIKTLDLREVNGDGAHALVEAATKTTTLEVLKMVGEHLARLCLSTVVLPATQGNVLRAVRIEFSAVARKEFMPFLASLDRLEHLEFGMSAHIPDEMDAVEFVLPVGYLPRLIRFGGPARSVMSVCAGRRIRHLLIDHLGEDDTPDTYLRALEGVSGLDTLEVASVADLDEPFISEVLERLPGLRSLSITASKSGCKPEMQTLKVSSASLLLNIPRLTCSP